SERSKEPVIDVRDRIPYSQTYAPPNDRIRIRTNEPRLFALADRWWVRTVSSPSGEDGRRDELDFALSVAPDGDRRPAAEASEHWTIEPDRVSLEFAGSLLLRIEYHPPRVTGHVSEFLLSTRPADVARLL